MLSPSSRYRLYSGAGSGGDEELQTDVMRFVAILGLSLTAIFALIQSLPLPPEDPRPRLESSRTLATDIAAQQQRLEILQAKLDALGAELDQRRLQLERVKAESRQAEQQRSVSQGALQAVNAELAEHRAQLADIESRRREGRRSLVQLRRRLQREQQALSALEQRLEVPAEAPVEVPDRPAPPLQEATGKEAPEPPVGFALRFASVEVLRQLVAQRQVGFFAILGKRAWRLSVARDKPVFQRADAPGQLYEMTPSTVPPTFWQAFQKKTAVYDVKRVIWGVSLPAGLRGEIDSAVQAGSGGELVIQGDGRLRIETAQDAGQ